MLDRNSGNPRLRLAVHAALAGSSLVATFGSGAVSAADADAPAPGDASLSEVVVTGSRIAVPNEKSISPVISVSSADIQVSGATRVEDLLNQLPQVFSAQGSTVSNGADGTAQVNLRGLGSKRTLVLVNGLRLGPGDPTSGGASDINMIPTELIDSIEVLTGGASSVYGADAVGGVVNFKLNDHFEGVKLVADGGIYNHTNDNTQGVQAAVTDKGFTPAPSSVSPGAQKSLAFIAGLNSPDGKGNATFYATYRNVAAILQSQYSISACTLGSGYIGSGSKFFCGGSSTSYPGRFKGTSPNGTPYNDTLGPNGTLVPYTSADAYNYGALNYFQRPDERYTAGAFLHYDFNDYANVYANTMFMQDTSLAQIAGSGIFFSPQSVDCANPFFTASELTTFCGGSKLGNAIIDIGRRNVEGGGRVADLQHTDFREVIGIKGKIADGWDYDASFQYSRVDLLLSQNNYFSNSKISNALNVTGTAANPVCASGPPCVPYNIFQLGGVTPAALAYLEVPGELTGNITQTIVNANVTGDLGRYGVQLPTASSGLKLNIGVEYRDAKAATLPDAELQAGDLAGSGGATVPVAGGLIAREAFVELRMPLAEDQFLAKSLDFETGYRYSDYSQGFKTNTFKFGVDWSPVEDVRLRGSFSRAVRAPNIAELFAPSTVALDGSYNADPCASNNPGQAPKASPAACARTGVTPGEYGNIVSNPAAQYNGLLGGNQNLQPETALTSSFGIGLTPSFIPNFRVQVDYFDIKIESIINNIGANTILNECINNDLLCNDIHRDTTPGAEGSLWLTNNGYIADTLLNVGQIEEKGVDFDLSYRHDLGGFGRALFSFNGTYLSSYEVTAIQNDPTTKYSCTGYYGTTCSNSTGGPAFRWRHTLRGTWQTPWDALDLTATWRYYSPVKNEILSGNPNVADGTVAPATVANGQISNTDAYVSSRSYLDLSASVKVSDHVNLRLGVNNLLDKDPPVIGASSIPGTVGNGNTFPGVYDALGRYLFAQVTATF